MYRMSSLFCLGIFVGLPASAAVIDSFNVGSLSFTNAKSGTALQENLGTNDVFGVKRELDFSTRGSISGADLQIANRAGQLRATVDGGLANVSLSYSYLNSPFAATDFLAEGNDRFLIEAQLSDAAPTLIYSLLVTTGTQGSVTESVSFGLDEAAPGGSGVIEIPFSDFTQVDFTEVRDIQLNFRVWGGLVLEMNQIVTIPEPTSMLLLSMLALGLRRR